MTPPYYVRVIVTMFRLGIRCSKVTGERAFFLGLLGFISG